MSDLSVAAASASLQTARATLDLTTQRISEGAVTPEVVSARDLAATRIEAGTAIFKEALQAQAQILDLLV